MDEPKVDVCLAPNCGKPASSRGLCKSCYSSAANMVRHEEITWEQLIERGLATGLKKCGPRRRSPIAAAILNGDQK